MKSKILCSLLICCISFCNAQSHQDVDSVLYYANHFNEFSSKEGKVDSSVFLLKRLAIYTPKTFPGIFSETIDDAFIQQFIKYSKGEMKEYIYPYSDSALTAQLSGMKERYNAGQLIINKSIKDTNSLIQKYITPLKYWVDEQNMLQENKATKNISEQFFQRYIYHSSLDSATKLYYLKYALLLYRIESSQPNNVKYAQQLLQNIFGHLNTLYNYYLSNNDKLNRQSLSKAKWLYAYTSFIIANNYLSQGEKKEAEPYLRQAALLSPNLTDQSIKGSYFYDAVVLTHNSEKFDFYKDYINFLEKNNSPGSSIQSVFVDYALNYPENKKDLEAYYNAHNDTIVLPFEKFWEDANRTITKVAPNFSVKKIDGEIFDLSANKGKWVLLDFWGTWCGPCRAEHKELNDFYLKSKENKRNIEVITFACRDTFPTVTKYMKAYNYSFPVAMQQEKTDIEKMYPVNGYPSKFLINPKGEYVVIPFGINWVTFINGYMGDAK